MLLEVEEGGDDDGAGVAVGAGEEEGVSNNPFHFTPVIMEREMLTIRLDPPIGPLNKLATLLALARIAFGLMCGRTMRWTIRHVPEQRQ